jgi:hypothetical protein
MSTLGSEQLNDHDTQSSTSFASKKRPRTSRIWDHMPVPRETIILNNQGKVIWRCTYCRKEYQESSGTAVVTTHLLEAHSISISSVQAFKIAARQGNIIDAFERTGEYKRRCLSDADTSLTTVLDPAVVERLYIQWIVACGVSFRMVEREEFRT